MESLGIGCPRRREEIQRDTDKQWDSTSQRIPYRGGKKRSVQGPPVVGGRDLPSAAARGGHDVGERRKRERTRGGRRGSCDPGADLNWSRFQEIGCRTRVGRHGWVQPNIQRAHFKKKRFLTIAKTF